MKDQETNSGSSAEPKKRTQECKCLNCKERFLTYEDARNHWAETCPCGGYLAPINDIIVEVKGVRS